jgi:hypothetical protein
LIFYLKDDYSSYFRIILYLNGQKIEYKGVRYNNYDTMEITREEFVFCILLLLGGIFSGCVTPTSSPPTCGNGIIDPGETCFNCPEDIGPCSGGRIMKMNKAYASSYPNELVNTLTMYDVIQMGADTSDSRALLVAVKQQKPDIVFYSYEFPWAYGPSADAKVPHPIEWEQINTHEDWFLHTDDTPGNPGSGTQRIPYKGGDYYLMNIAPGSGWIDAYKQILQWTTQPEQGAADGWHFDECKTKDQIKESAPTITKEIYQNWEYWVVNLMNEFRVAFPGKWVGPNCVPYAPFFDGINGVPGFNDVETEIFIHPTWKPFDENHPGYSEESCLEHMKFYQYYMDRGVRVRVTDGCYMTWYWKWVSDPVNNPSSPTTEDAIKIQNIFRLCLACFLLINSATYWNNSCFAFNKLREGSPDAPYYGYYGPEMDYDWGRPLTDFYAIRELFGPSGLYARDFTTGTVYANLSTEHSFTIEVDGENVVIPPRGAWFPSDVN